VRPSTLRGEIVTRRRHRGSARSNPRPAEPSQRFVHRGTLANHVLGSLPTSGRGLPSSAYDTSRQALCVVSARGCPACRRSEGEFVTQTHRVIGFKCRESDYKWVG